MRWREGLANSFLDHLTATCDVEGSARRIGIAPARIYRRLRNDAAFADAWAGALRAAHLMIETGMTAHILANAKADGTDANWDRGLKLLQQTARRNGLDRKGIDGKDGATVAIATRDETDKAIEQRLARLAARKVAGSAGAAGAAA